MVIEKKVYWVTRLRKWEYDIDSLLPYENKVTSFFFILSRLRYRTSCFRSTYFVLYASVTLLCIELCIYFNKWWAECVSGVGGSRPGRPRHSLFSFFSFFGQSLRRGRSLFWFSASPLFLPAIAFSLARSFFGERSLTSFAFGLSVLSFRHEG